LRRRQGAARFSRATVERKDFRWLELLRAKAGDDFVHGFVLYCGDRPSPSATV
jgi:hypothetical protein